MMYATHKAGGALFALVGFELLRSNQLLIPDLEPWVQLIMLYPAASFGSTYPDLDHHWGSVKEKTPFNFLVHKVIHLSKPKHRSWQTHCILLTIAELAVLFSLIYALTVIPQAVLSTTAIAIIRLLVMGFGLGVFSHLFLDAFTTQGVHLIPGVMVRLVPKSKTFSTDTPYETVWRVLLYILTALMLIWVINPFGLQEMILSAIGGD